MGSSSSSYNNIYLLFLVVCTFVSLSASLLSSAVIVEIPPSAASPPTPTSLLDVTNRTIQSTKWYLFNTNDMILEREIQATIVGNTTLKEQFHECRVQYNTSINALAQSLTYLQIGKYKILPSLASTALLQVQKCDLNFVPIGSEPADFKARNQVSIDHCTKLVAVVNRFVASHKNLFF